MPWAGTRVVLAADYLQGVDRMPLEQLRQLGFVPNEVHTGDHAEFGWRGPTFALTTPITPRSLSRSTGSSTRQVRRLCRVPDQEVRGSYFKTAPKRGHRSSSERDPPVHQGRGARGRLARGLRGDRRRS